METVKTQKPTLSPRLNLKRAPGPSRQSSGSDAGASVFPRSLSGWFSRVMATGGNQHSPSVHGSASESPVTNQKIARSLAGLDRMLDRALRHFTDPDASMDQCPDDIWLIGGIVHQGWRPDPPLSRDVTSRAKDTTRKEADRPSLSNTRGEVTQSHRRFRKALRKRQERLPAHRTARETAASDEDDLVQIDVSDGCAWFNDGLKGGPPSPSMLSSMGSSENDHSVDPRQPISEIHAQGWPLPFFLDFTSRFQLTYRSGFDPIPYVARHNVTRTLTSALSALSSTWTDASSEPLSGSLSSDSGWGCMLRTGQSLLANALAFIHLGRDWRREPTFSGSHVQHGAYVRLLTWFFDDPSDLCPFSVHRFALKGQDLGKQIGEWFGPSTAAGAIQSLANAFSPAGLAVMTANDGTIYRQEAQELSMGWSRPLLILLNLRLGLERVTPVYYDSIKALFYLPQLVGIAGGRPSSSYFFVGSQADSLFYFDPHHTQDALAARPIPSELHQAALTLPILDTFDGREGAKQTASTAAVSLDEFYAALYKREELQSYHCDRVRKMPLSALDPSMLVGLLCRSQVDLDSLCMGLQSIKPPVVGIAEQIPRWIRNVRGSPSAKYRERQRPSADLTRPSGVQVDDDDDNAAEASFDEPEDAWCITDGSSDLGGP